MPFSMEEIKRGFDFGKYSHSVILNQNPPWNMDERHIQKLYSILKARAWESVIEVGSYYGASTSAFVEAINTGSEFKFHIIEPSITDSLRRVIGQCEKKDQIVFHQCTSFEAAIPAEFVFIDGDHGWPALVDLCRALTMGAKCVAFHDSRSHLEGFGGHHGAYIAAEVMRQAIGWDYLEDSRRREGEWTHRGFMVAYRKEIAEEIKQCWELS
jgi:hypothetical protein